MKKLIFVLIFLCLGALLISCGSEKTGSGVVVADTVTEQEISETFQSDTETSDTRFETEVQMNDQIISSDTDAYSGSGSVQADVSESNSPLAGKKILIDPGHGIYSANYQEPIAPNTTETKKAFSTGTAGAYMDEHELNLKVGLMLRDKLLELGADVYMTRTTAECDVSNVMRAEMGNDIGAEAVVRIHADGSDDPNVKGMSMLVPGGKYLTDEEMISKSTKLGEDILAAVVASTGTQSSRGISVRNDMTGFNWSKVPVCLLEMGFMSNREEDDLLASEEYQAKIVNGIADGLIYYFTNTGDM